MYLGAPLLGVYMLTSVGSSGFGSCVIVCWPSSLKSVFSVKGAAVPPLAFSVCMKCLCSPSRRQLMWAPLPWSGSLTGGTVEPFLKNPVCNAASFTPLTFKVIIDNYVFTATLNLFSHWFYIFSFSFCGFMIFSCITLKFSSFCFLMDLFCFWFVLTLFFKDINPLSPFP